MIDVISDKVDKLVQTVMAARDNAKAEAASATTGRKVAVSSQQLTEAKVAQPEANPAAVEAAVNKVNGELKRMKSKMSLSIDQDTNRVLMRFKDPDSGQVVRQIPSDVVLQLAKHFNEIKGAILDLEG